MRLHCQMMMMMAADVVAMTQMTAEVQAWLEVEVVVESTVVGLDQSVVLVAEEPALDLQQYIEHHSHLILAMTLVYMLNINVPSKFI